LKVIIIFHGQGLVPHEEYRLYDPRVQVMFNDMAFCNEEVMYKWIDGHMLLYLDEDCYNEPATSVKNPPPPAGQAGPQSKTLILIPGKAKLDSKTYG
jgi:hypothetical protein